MKKRIFIAGEGIHMDNYYNAIVSSGHEAVVSLDLTLAEDCDGLLLPGGVDIHPRCYRQEINGSVNIDEALDKAQFAALTWFLEKKKPVFGICRGHQLLNVYFGGSLIQHLPAYRLHTQSSGDNAHLTDALPDSFLGKLYGDHFVTNSKHHQAVDRLADGFTVIQHSQDGVVEAMVHNTLPVCSVQWHPERMAYEKRRDDTVDGGILFRYLLESFY